MTYTIFPATLPAPHERFYACGRVVLHCGRDVATFANEHDAQHAVKMLHEIFAEVNGYDVFTALFCHSETL